MKQLAHIAYQSLLDMTTEEGINASGREEIYGCIFGRDSAITILKILKVYENQSSHTLFEMDSLRNICQRTLLTLTSLQGKEKNIESGEEPGKFIHEFRRERYEHLLALPTPWYLYPDKMLRNYDSLDATPLGLYAIYRYWEVTRDSEFLLKVLPAVEKGLTWILTGSDLDGDYLAEYELHPSRTYGGLKVQSWTDSNESLTRPDGSFPDYPIAPVEVQGYMWLSLQVWADFFESESHMVRNGKRFARSLRSYAQKMKKRFNEAFIFKDNEGYFAAQALDKHKNQIQTVTGNPLLLLWASHKKKGEIESIIDSQFVNDIVKRSFMPDMFDPDGGIRTMSALSLTYNPGADSYHNGSFWPKLNGMAHEGLVNWKFYDHAKLLKEATLKPIMYFGSPVELYMKGENGTYVEYKNETGQVGCRNQAWSAASVLDLLTVE